MHTKTMSDTTMTGPSSIALALLLTLLSGCGSQGDSAATRPAPVTAGIDGACPPRALFQAGFAYSHIGGNYDSDVSSIELGKMRAAGGNTVQFLVFAYIYQLNAPGIGMAQERSDRVLRGGISRAKAAGLRAMVKLQMWGPGFQDGKFSADIAMSNAAIGGPSWQLPALRAALRPPAADTNADILWHRHGNVQPPSPQPIPAIGAHSPQRCATVYFRPPGPMRRITAR